MHNKTGCIETPLHYANTLLVRAKYSSKDIRYVLVSMGLQILAWTPGLWVDSNEAGTLLVSLGPHAFDKFELLPVDEGTVLLSPLCNTPCPAYIKTCYMPRKDDNNSLCSVHVIKHTKSSKNWEKKNRNLVEVRVFDSRSLCFPVADDVRKSPVKINLWENHSLVTK